MIYYSTHLNDQAEVPVLKNGAALLFKYEAVTSESENKVRVFSPFPKVPVVNLTEAEELLARPKIGILGVAGMYSQVRCDYTMVNETYGILITQLKDRLNLIKLELNQTTEEQGTLADVI